MVSSLISVQKINHAVFKENFFRPFDFNVTYEHMLCENICVLDFPFLNIQIIKTNLVEFDQN